MDGFNHSVANLTRLLYDEYNERSLKSLPSFGLYFELVYTEENLIKYLNVVYKELNELNGKVYTPLSSLDELREFSKSNGMHHRKNIFFLGFLDPESLVELLSARMKESKRLVSHLVLYGCDTPFDACVVAKLNELKLKDMEESPGQETSNKKRQLSGTQLNESQLGELRKMTDELSKDYFSRWHAYIDRFYNLLDVLFKVKKFKDSKELRLLLETMKVWRKNTEFREVTLYDLYTYKPDHTNVTKISSKTNKSNRVVEFYDKIKTEFK
ncbi:hypothetical protein TOT_010000741 [Theileria orientalis strain Shintoku]|uniref:Uncharacterized protein n=1 Tax=Theileria orientalis strain Shintoku TaxID=869250 RepID=J4CCF1_THEOR|nr:hypothetical protein TOT_010000741 [Theileria orientalis strain Shintoku]PVC51969.1 hypothetical protein MACL_00001123 [Theileria orientalis]BAM39282.1 hypothetical protein TOT_010000741 [Theileria orientalis strain Shintoku]|eukprot:XP_009689583.1 hypothetical protein TOT_010000741 [Theileria orientalis strain Shintoku]